MIVTGNIGEIIDNKYELTQYINKGGMSVVYLAINTRLGNRWAIKEIRKTDDENGKLYINSLVAEANIMKDFDHPAFPRIVDIVETDEYLYLVMDYIEGQTLEQIIKKEGPRDEETVARWAQELCGALSYLHRRRPPIIYRDMKPSNIILKPDGSLKIIDFGTARVFNPQKTADTVALGTRGFAPPEQYSGRTDARSDIYALGMTMLYLITGINPCYNDYSVFQSDEVKGKMSGAMRGVIEKCTALDPERRYQNCDALLSDLRRLHFRSQKPKKQKINGKLAAKIIIPVAAVLLVGAVICISLAVINNGTDRSSSPAKETSQTAGSSSKPASSSSKAAEGYALVPNTVGRTVNDAVSEMKKAGFQVTTKKEFSDKVKEGCVISQSAVAGNMVKKSTVITLTISEGKKPESKAESSKSSESSSRSSDENTDYSSQDDEQYYSPAPAQSSVYESSEEPSDNFEAEFRDDLSSEDDPRGDEGLGGEDYGGGDNFGGNAYNGGEDNAEP